MKLFESVSRPINKYVFFLAIINISLFAGDENQALFKGASGAATQNLLYESAVCADSAKDASRAASLFGQYLETCKNGDHVALAALFLVKELIGLKEYDHAAVILDKAYKNRWNDGPLFTRFLYYKAKLSSVLLKNDNACRFYSALVNGPEDFPEKQAAYDEYKSLLKKMADFQSALDSFPAKAEVCMELGNIYFENNEFDRAFTSFERACKSSSTVMDSAGALVGEIKALILDGQEKKAEKSIEVFKGRFGATGPLAAEIAFSKGLRRLIEKDYDKAIVVFKGFEEKFVGSSRIEDAAYQLGLCYYYKGKTDKAFALFNEFLARYPESRFQPTAYFKIGMIYHDRGDFVQAAQLFERAQGFAGADEKTRFRAAYNAALDYQKSSSWLQAARMYGVIVDSFPREVSVSSTYLKIAFCFIQGARFKDALKQLEKAGGSVPSAEEKPEILYWTAVCLEKLGDERKAIAEFLKVPASYEKVGEWAITSEFEAARLYERAGEPKKALGLYKKIALSDAGEIGKEATANVSRLSILTKEN